MNCCSSETPLPASPRRSSSRGPGLGQTCCACKSPQYQRGNDSKLHPDSADDLDLNRMPCDLPAPARRACARQHISHPNCRQTNGVPKRHSIIHSQSGPIPVPLGHPSIPAKGSPNSQYPNTSGTQERTPLGRISVCQSYRAGASAVVKARHNYQEAANWRPHEKLQEAGHDSCHTCMAHTIMMLIHALLLVFPALIRVL